MPYSQITSVPAPETTTALAIRGQLAEAQERLVKAEKRWNNGHAGDGPCLGGLGAAFAAFVALGISGSPAWSFWLEALCPPESESAFRSWMEKD